MANPQNQKPPFALRALGAFAATLAVLFALLLAAYALPGGPVRDHVYTSAQTIAEEGLYPEYFGFKLFQMDNYTDTVMLFEAASAIGTVGLSLGATAEASEASRLILIFLMYFGRVGGLTMIYAMAAGSNGASSQYPQEQVTVG